MRILLPILFVFVPSFASKEHVPLRNLPEYEKDILFQLVKRLGKDSDYEYGLGWSEKDQSLSQCTVSTNTSSIIKRIDSENNGATFLTLHEEIETNDACSNLCCKNKTCDLAVYENKGEHHCYLFQCEGKCLFGHHSSYISNRIRRLPPQEQQLPSAAEGSELDLINLDQDSDTNVGVGNDKAEGSFPPTTPAASATQAPSPAPYIRAHSVGLEGPMCLRDQHCEDPNAVCNYHKCRCREEYYQKGHICRKNCAPSEFGCLELGTLGRGPECVSKSQVCDSVMQCADGSDEFNCPESGGPYKTEGGPSKDNKSPLQGGDAGKLSGNPEAKPDTPSKVDSQAPEPDDDVSSADDKDKSMAQQASSSSDTEDGNGNSNSKQSPDDNKQTHQKVAEKDNPAKTMPTEEDKPHGFPKEDSSDLAKDTGTHPQTGFGKGSGDSNDLIQSQNDFISRTKLDLPKETANMQGPIIALSLGLAFTVILLIFVTCRLRTVRRRLRKGRPLHSNEADYLINGMYL